MPIIPRKPDFLSDEEYNFILRHGYHLCAPSDVDTKTEIDADRQIAAAKLCGYGMSQMSAFNHQIMARANRKNINDKRDDYEVETP